ncbi:probable WRKY transcription factor 2 isoform X2 [Tripterygium wilfordii]|uniref:probable WRKY transcription factor 2 isoform X2 n=1 Tax=Tripterygium wilfordii TaxID=458696 RepID=UPI0018F82255|nr:probable WRKY transcription factor 2 isoform X2 [Tripterygium wilfordii]
MTGIDDSVAMIGDWVPPSPSPRAFFSALLGDDISTRSILESPEENKSEGHFMGSQEQMTSGSPDNKDAALRGDQMTQLGSLSEQKSSSRGGLVERMAARAGFNAPRLNTENIRSTDLSPEAEVWSPYLTIPPGLSPTTLLDSPVFLSNSSVHPATLQQQFSSIDVSFHSANSLQCNGGPAKVQSQNGNNVHLPADLSRLSSEKDDRGNTLTTDQRVFDNVGSSAEHSPPLDEQHDEGDQRASGDSMLASSGGAPSEDGYNWRKYGQKQVKGSEYPRSYYKCTYPNCQVKKKVERSHEGHITEIIYKGAHNHPKPPPNRRSVIGSSNPLTDLQPEAPDQTGPQSNADNDPVWASTQRGTTGGTPDWRQDNVEVTSASIGPEFGNPSTSLQAQNRNHFESGDAVDASSTFSNDEDEDDRGTHGSVSLGYDGEGDESESKRRKIETYATEMSGATRAIREPRVVVQTTSEVDILDDGYRWRKYGQKVVKGNPNPRSYYKCTNAGCTVRKHVERASHDLKSVITTYEGKHNHVVPAARNSSHVNSGNSNSVPAQAGAVQAHVHRPEPSQVHNMSRFERPASLGSFSLPGRQQMGTSPGFSFVMNQPGLANLGMAGLGPGQSKLPVLPVRSYMASQHQVNDMGFMLPKGEPKVEPVLDPGMNLSTNSALYQQLMSRLPLGPQM